MMTRPGLEEAIQIESWRRRKARTAPVREPGAAERKEKEAKPGSGPRSWFSGGLNAYRALLFESLRKLNAFRQL